MTAIPTIRIRAYNVGFGDCFLVKIPDGPDVRWLLIDFGNAPGQRNDRFDEIAKDIKKETGGKIDVVVMTHEHLDHMEGFFSMKDAFNDMSFKQVWMSIPSDPDYYDKYPNARKHKNLRMAARVFADANTRTLAPSFRTLLRNNLTNVERVDYLRGLSNKVRYLRRNSSMKSAPTSAKIKFRVLAPERDMSAYYSGDSNHHLRALSGVLDAPPKDSGWRTLSQAKTVPKPVNLSSADWDQLRDLIQTGAVDAVRTLDKAANNTSLVFEIEAHGKRLLFTGDAELESWEIIDEKVKLKPVDFLKVSHHGSHNGTPLKLLDTLLPAARKDKAQLLLSTKAKVYGTINPVPDKALLKELKKRCKKLHSTEGDLLYIDVDV